MSVGVMTPTTVMRMHSALIQRGVTPAPAILATLEMESLVQVSTVDREIFVAKNILSVAYNDEN